MSKQDEYIFLVFDEWGWHPFWAYKDEKDGTWRTDAFWEGFGGPVCYRSSFTPEEVLQKINNSFGEAGKLVVDEYFTCDATADYHRVPLYEFVARLPDLYKREALDDIANVHPKAYGPFTGKDPRNEDAHPLGEDYDPEEDDDIDMSAIDPFALWDEDEEDDTVVWDD